MLIFSIFLISIPIYFIRAGLSDSIDEPIPMTLHQVKSGYFEDADVDFYALKLVIGRTYKIILYSPPTQTNKYLGLYDSTKTLIQSDNTQPDYVITRVPTRTEDYYIELKASNPAEYGQYQLVVIDTTPCSSTCLDCQTITDLCPICMDGHQCNSCSTSSIEYTYQYGGSCYCAQDEYFSSGSCLMELCHKKGLTRKIACRSIDPNCAGCSDSSVCTVCGNDKFLEGNICVPSCSLGSYGDNGLCISCQTFDPYCLKCSDNSICQQCQSGKLMYESKCYDQCPSGTKKKGEKCVLIPLTITLLNTDSAKIYTVQFPSPLTADNTPIPLLSTISLAGIDPSAYKYTLKKITQNLYQLKIQNFQSIPSSTLTFTYTLDGSQPTSNVLRGSWTAEITSKYMAFISDSNQKLMDKTSKAIDTTLKAASAGAGSVAILGGNPTLLWPLLSLFQSFYYLIFIDVNYPANVQIFLKVFSLGSLSFLPNPLKWFVKNIDDYNLPVPKRYNDYDFSGLFLDNAGNELLFLAFVCGIYVVSKIVKKWVRRLPNLPRLMSNKTISWFEWSGILKSLTTSYTDIAQAIFLQLKFLSFSSMVFTLSSILTFLTLIFIVILPVFLVRIIRKYDKNPEKLPGHYQTFFKEYDIKKKSGRYFVIIWLLRRLITCLALVFLQGNPIIQINILCTMMIGAIIYSVSCCPFPTKKENICNILIELFFGSIHVVIYVLIYDDQNPNFSEEKRLQMGWTIIAACGCILIISLGLNFIEQVKAIIEAVKLFKKLLSKKDKKRSDKRKKVIERDMIFQRSQSRFSEQNVSNLFDLDRTQLDVSNYEEGFSPNKRQRRIKFAVRIKS